MTELQGDITTLSTEDTQSAAAADAPETASAGWFQVIHWPLLTLITNYTTIQSDFGFHNLFYGFQIIIVIVIGLM